MKDFDLNKVEITHIQFFDFAIPMETETGFEMIYSYSANIVINDSFIVQVSGDKESSTFNGVSSSSDCFWASEETQDKAYNSISDGELREALEKIGFENNVGWLEDNADEVANPEYAKYRRQY